MQPSNNVGLLRAAEINQFWRKISWQTVSKVDKNAPYKGVGLQPSRPNITKNE